MPGKEPQTSEKIISAAKQVFADKGLAGARMHQIAKAAGVNQALLHYYFGSKEKLYQEVIYNVYYDIFSNLSESFNEKTAIDEAFSDFIRGVIDILENNPEFPRLMLSEIIEGGGNIKIALGRVFRDIDATPPAFIVPLITTASKKGEIRNVDPMQTAISILGMCLIYFIGKPIIQFIWDGPEDEHRFLDERKDAIIDLVLHGLLQK